MDEVIVELEVIEKRYFRALRHGKKSTGNIAHRRAVAQKMGDARENAADHPLRGASCFVEVDLLEHEEPRQHESFERHDAFASVDGERGGGAAAMRAAFGHWPKPEAAQQPVEIVAPVGHAGPVGVAQKIVAAIDVDGAADGAGEIGELVPAEDE